MRNTPIVATTLVLALALVPALAPRGALRAQTPELAPIRHLAPAAWKTLEPLPGLTAIHALSDGRVLIDDYGSRRVLLLDSTLAHVQVVLDTTAATGNSYGSSFHPMVPFGGDSSLLLDFNGQIRTLRVLDPDGHIARTMLIAQDVIAHYFSLPEGALDHAGRLISRGPSSFDTPQEFIGDTVIAGPDRLPLLRFDPSTKRTDTLAMLTAPLEYQAISKRPGRSDGSSVASPIPRPGDEWVELHDGTIAILRIRDYHVDWVHPDGSTTSGPTIPHVWKPITDSMKTAIMDSVEHMPAVLRAIANYPVDSATYDSLALVFAANPDVVVGPDGKPRHPFPPSRPHFVPPAALPDMRPPFSPGVMADVEGNLWVHALPGVAGGQLFEAIDRRDVMVDRVQLPPGATLLGFCPGYVILRAQSGRNVDIMKAPIH